MNPFVNYSGRFSRRHFLKAAGWLAVIGWIAAWSKMVKRQNLMEPGKIVRIPQAEVKPGITVFDQFYLYRKGETTRAFSLTCTHAGCKIYASDDSIMSCPCHGSQYEALTGNSVKGPAFKALKALECRYDVKTASWLVTIDENG